MISFNLTYWAAQSDKRLQKYNTFCKSMTSKNDLTANAIYSLSTHELQTSLVIFMVYMLWTQYLYTIYTISMWYLCNIYAISTQYLRDIYTISTYHLLTAFEISTIYMLCTHYLCTICTISMQYLHDIYASLVFVFFASYTLFPGI